MGKYISFASLPNSVTFDTENLVVNNVIMAQVAEAEGHGLHVDQEFIEMAAADCQKRFASKGLLADCDHNRSGGMGKQLGVFKNIRVEGTKLLGDLHLYKSANLSPTHPGMADWFMSLAQEDKRAINSSIKFKEAGYFQKQKDGTKFRIWYRDKELGWISSNPKLGKIFFEFGSMKKCDLVTDGALTDKLFDKDTMFNQFKDIVFHPEFMQMLELSEDEFPQLQDYFQTKEEQSFLSKVKNYIMGNTSNKDQNQSTENQEQNLSVAEQLQALSARLEKLEGGNETPAEETTPAEDDTELQSLKDQVKELSEKLKKDEGDIAEETTFETETEDTSDDETPGYINALSIHDRAIELGLDVSRKPSKK